MKSRKPAAGRGTRSVSGWLKGTRSAWAVLAQAGVWLVGLMSGFLLPPPVGVYSSGDRTWLRLAQFSVAVLAGLALFAALKWKGPRHAGRWWMAACGALILGVVAFFAYQHQLYAWTGEYDGRMMVVGSEYTQAGRDYVTRNPTLPLDRLLEDFIGRPEDVWTRRLINQRRTTLAGVYVSCLPLFTLSVIAVVQALRCLKAVR